ncbi:hypothetical protein CBZ_07180 [Cellulomonas biazotea]|uniref:AAA+ ATPase domain-containing protein n=1 Tax=Cellulomonas biazotea TaxID=1709 RepID=A0A402DND6_9CELL|nr:hypothetical protein CBZ_07180 [Cellulomonas biazotea]
MASPEERRALLSAITSEATAACVQLDDNRDPATRRVGESLYTSTELLVAEKVLIDAAEADGFPHRARAMLGQPALRTEQHLGALAADQRAAAEAVVTSGRLLDVLVGPAGSGKTSTLAALTTFWGRGIGPVVGLAPSATAARALAESLGIPCETTAKWLHESTGDGGTARALRYADAIAREAAGDFREMRAAREEQWRVRAEQDKWRFSPGQLVIVDEASLADTRTLAAIVEQARAATAKVLLVGDHLQRGSVDARRGVRHARPSRTHRRAHQPLAVQPAVGGPREPRVAPRAPGRARRLRGPRRDQLRRPRRHARHRDQRRHYGQ